MTESTTPREAPKSAYGQLAPEDRCLVEKQIRFLYEKRLKEGGFKFPFDASDDPKLFEKNIRTFFAYLRSFFSVPENLQHLREGELIRLANAAQYNPHYVVECPIDPIVVLNGRSKKDCQNER